MVLKSSLQLPFLPPELLHIILEFYFESLEHNNAQWPPPLACPLILVSRAFRSICQPLHLKRLANLELNDALTYKSRTVKVVRFFENNPHLRQYVKRVDFKLTAGRWGSTEIEPHLKRYNFPSLDTISFTCLCTADSTRRSSVYDQSIPCHFIAPLRSVHTLELRNFPHVYLPGYFEIESLTTLKIQNAHTSLYSLVRRPTGIIRAVSNITTLKFDGARTEFKPYDTRRIFDLPALKLLPRLVELVIQRVDRFHTMEDQPIPFVIELESRTSFNLRKLVVHARSGHNMRELFHFYEEEAHLASVDNPFRSLRHLDIHGETGGVPVDCLVPVLQSTPLQRFSLSWGSRNVNIMSDIITLYDTVSEIIITETAPLDSLDIPIYVGFCLEPFTDSYTEATNGMLAFLDIIAQRNHLKSLQINFIADIDHRPLSEVTGPLIQAPWIKFADLLKSSTKFPALHTVVVKWDFKQEFDYRSDEEYTPTEQKFIMNHYLEGMSTLEGRAGMCVTLKPQFKITVHDSFKWGSE